MLGSFKGRISAIGPNLTYNFQVGKVPVLTSVRFLHEFDAKNRLAGNVEVFTLTIQLSGAAAQAQGPVERTEQRLYRPDQPGHDAALCAKAGQDEGVCAAGGGEGEGPRRWGLREESGHSLESERCGGDFDSHNKFFSGSLLAPPARQE
ncbi:MAG: uncharacterized protein JWM36_789 [Hyphomicrobiales bacterium]|nr:uncharacterized protein [Hyphomicrobiales bacterium]